MNILVTGGTGFIGQHLVTALIKAGHRVKVIVRDSQKAKKISGSGGEAIVGGLGDTVFLKKALSGIEVVYHLAAIPGQIWGFSQKDYQKVNVGYTKNLLEASFLGKVKRFIFCSSIQAAAPSTFYGRSKLEAEKLVKESGLDYVLVRPGVVYGPEETRSFLRFCRLAKTGFFPLPDGGKAKLATVFVNDLIALFLLSLSPKVKNRVLWGIGEEMPSENIVRMISQELGISCRIISLPTNLFKILALPFEFLAKITGQRPLLSRYQVDFLTFNWHFKDKVRKQKFWQPQTDLQTGIAKTVRWYKEEGFL